MNRGMVLLQLCAVRFNTKKLCLFDVNGSLFTKMTNLLFEPPFGDLGATYTLLCSSLESAWPTSYSR